MATPAAEPQVYSWTPEVHRLAARIAVVLERCGLPCPHIDKLTNDVYGLDAAMRRFAANAWHWRHQDQPQSRTALQSHLVFTLLVPGGKASKARVAVELLQQNLLPWSPWRDAAGNSYGLTTEETDVIGLALAGNARFPNQKADRVIRALDRWDQLVSAVTTPDFNAATATQRREIVMNNVKGYGEKAAAHFMRNTGLMSGWSALPIIDTHIHKALESLGFRHNGYAEAEPGFASLAHLTGVPPLLLDAVLWSAYAQNWNASTADFDNFGILNTIREHELSEQ